MKKILTVVLSIMLLSGCGTSGSELTYKQISTDEAVTMMQEESNYIILDVRTEEEYEEKHIPGAICIPNETIGSDEIPELADKEQLIMVYCRSGNRSKQAAEKLVKLGYTNIVEFGGINDWAGEQLPGTNTNNKPSTEAVFSENDGGTSEQENNVENEPLDDLKYTAYENFDILDEVANASKDEW